MIYIWSDLHLNHKNIIEYENRPFSSVQEMNKTLLSAWRTHIKGNDTIINLGDVFLSGDKESCTQIIKNLPGKKILVMGNHDRQHSLRWWLDVGFDEVYPYPIIYDSFYILSHEPLYVSKKMPYANIHGHTHSSSFDNPQMVNVSVDVLGFVPFSFDEIKIRMYLSPMEAE